MTISRKMLLALPLPLLVISCTPNDIAMGTSVRNNNAAHIVEPDPKYEDDQVAAGSQVAGAQERYRTNRVIKPKPVKTTEGSSSGGGGSSSGGSN
jgi:hypothetical protein